MNGGETDVDCGGATTCAKCADGKHCAAATDCAGNRCTAGTCTSCTDGKMNADESDADCGGTMCTACANGKRCVATTDCASRICNGNVCVAANCTDTVLNGSESDVDCGGIDCKRCTRGPDLQGRHGLRHRRLHGRTLRGGELHRRREEPGRDRRRLRRHHRLPALRRLQDLRGADGLRDQRMHDELLRDDRLPVVRDDGRLRRLPADGAGRDAALRGHPDDGHPANGGQRRQLHDADAAVLVQLLRCGADVGAGQRLGRAQLQLDQPVHHQLVPDAAARRR